MPTNALGSSNWGLTLATFRASPAQWHQYLVGYKELGAALKAHKAQGPLCSLCKSSLEEVESALADPSRI